MLLSMVCGAGHLGIKIPHCWGLVYAIGSYWPRCQSKWLWLNTFYKRSVLWYRCVRNPHECQRSVSKWYSWISLQNYPQHDPFTALQQHINSSPFQCPWFVQWYWKHYALLRECSIYRWWDGMKSSSVASVIHVKMLHLHHYWASVQCHVNRCILIHSSSDSQQLSNNIWHSWMHLEAYFAGSMEALW